MHSERCCAHSYAAGSGEAALWWELFGVSTLVRTNNADRMSDAGCSNCRDAVGARRWLRSPVLIGLDEWLDDSRPGDSEENPAVCGMDGVGNVVTSEEGLCVSKDEAMAWFKLTCGVFLRTSLFGA